MILKVNGVPVPTNPNGLSIEVEVAASGETLPPVTIAATGGRLDVWASRVSKSGNIVTHIFGEPKSGS
jgi:hypothetical protein